MNIFSTDIGGSETRCVKGTDEVFLAESDLLILDPKTPLADSVSDKYSACIIEMNGISKTLVKGESMNFHKMLPMTCDNNTLKAEYLGTYLNLLYAIARLSKGETEVDATIGICLPPAEAFGEAKGTFIDTLAGNSRVTFPLTGEVIDITIDSKAIHVVAEGAVAIFAIENETLKKAILKSSVVIIDIGYRSTDIMLLRNGTPYRGAYDSKPIGGINMESRLSSLLESQGIFLDKTDIRTALCTGEMQKQSKPFPIGNIIMAVKEEFAARVKQNVLDVLNAAGLNLSAVTHFLPIGRPFNTTGKEGSANYGGSLVSMLSEQLQIEAICKETENMTNIRGLVNLLNETDN